MSLEEPTTLDAPADIPAPERTLDIQNLGDSKDSDDERNRPTPSTSAPTSASAKKRNKREVNESGCEAFGAIQDYVLHKRTKIDTAGDVSAASFGRLVHAITKTSQKMDRVRERGGGGEEILFVIVLHSCSKIVSEIITYLCYRNNFTLCNLVCSLTLRNSWRRTA